MLGLLLVFASRSLMEVGDIIGKVEVKLKKESIYTMGFLNSIWGGVFFLFIAFFVRQSFLFSFESLPTFALRAFLEILQAHFTVIAIARADRSTFSFIRIATIPLLLIIDIFLGYAIGPQQVVGIFIIMGALFLLLFTHGIRKKGAWFVVFTAVNAAITISLYKYNITHFNSVEAEQSIITIILLIYFFFMAYSVRKENPIRFLAKPIFLTQSLAGGLGSVLMSFAYAFAPASIITTAKRSVAILLTMISGKLYFHEKHFQIKLIMFVILLLGLILLV